MFQEHEAGYFTSVPRLLATARWFREHPDGSMKTGMWTEPTWLALDFHAWLLRCLHRKIDREDGRTWRKLDPEYQDLQRRDARAVNDYARRVRHYGCSGLLVTPEMRRRYPHVNQQEMEE
jgi:hypothetical protein